MTQDTYTRCREIAGRHLESLTDELMAQGFGPWAVADVEALLDLLTANMMQAAALQKLGGAEALAYSRDASTCALVKKIGRRLMDAGQQVATAAEMGLERAKRQDAEQIENDFNVYRRTGATADRDRLWERTAGLARHGQQWGEAAASRFVDKSVTRWF